MASLVSPPISSIPTHQVGPSRCTTCSTNQSRLVMAPSCPRSVPYCQQIITNVSGMLSPIQWPSMNRTLNSKACTLTSRLLASYTSPDAKHLDHALSAGLRLSVSTSLPYRGSTPHLNAPAPRPLSAIGLRTRCRLLRTSNHTHHARISQQT